MDKVTTINGKLLSLLRIGNYLLLLAHIVSGFALVSIILSRNTFEAISSQVFPQSDLLMDSMFLNLFIRKEVAIIVALLIVATIVKEFFIPNFRNKFVLNIVIFGLATIFNVSVVYLLYSPVYNQWI